MHAGGRVGGHFAAVSHVPESSKRQVADGMAQRFSSRAVGHAPCTRPVHGPAAGSPQGASSLEPVQRRRVLVDADVPRPTYGSSRYSPPDESTRQSTTIATVNASRRRQSDWSSRDGTPPPVTSSPGVPPGSADAVRLSAVQRPARRTCCAGGPQGGTSARSADAGLVDRDVGQRWELERVLGTELAELLRYSRTSDGHSFFDVCHLHTT